MRGFGLSLAGVLALGLSACGGDVERDPTLEATGGRCSGRCSSTDPSATGTGGNTASLGSGGAGVNSGTSINAGMPSNAGGAADASEGGSTNTLVNDQVVCMSSSCVMDEGALDVSPGSVQVPKDCELACVPHDGTAAQAVIGTWRIEHECTKTLGAWALSCQDLSVDLRDAQVQGTITFREDGSYSKATQLIGTIELHYPSSCLVARSCEQLAPIFSSYFSQFSCRGVEDGCTCDVIQKPQIENGWYGARSNGELWTQRPSFMTLYSYCVAGTSLTIASLNDGTATHLEKL